MCELGACELDARSERGSDLLPTVISSSGQCLNKRKGGQYPSHDKSTSGREKRS